MSGRTQLRNDSGRMPCGGGKARDGVKIAWVVFTRPDVVFADDVPLERMSEVSVPALTSSGLDIPSTETPLPDLTHEVEQLIRDPPRHVPSHHHREVAH